MTFEEKVETIKINKDAIVQALNIVLDCYYDLIANYVTDDMSGKLIDNIPEEIKLTVTDIKSDIDNYNGIRTKLLNDDFSVTRLEVGYINNALLFSRIRTEKYVDTATEMLRLLNAITTVLISDENENNEEK